MNEVNGEVTHPCNAFYLRPSTSNSQARYRVKAWQRLDEGGMKMSFPSLSFLSLVVSSLTYLHSMPLASLTPSIPYLTNIILGDRWWGSPKAGYRKEREGS